MATFKRFEDILAWQKARTLVGQIYGICEESRFSKDYELRKQVCRSATSIMANIAEGQGRRTDRDFSHFLNISIGSVAETKSHMYIALDRGYISKDLFDDIYEKLDEIGRMLFGLILHLRKPSQTS